MPVFSPRWAGDKGLHKEADKKGQKEWRVAARETEPEVEVSRRPQLERQGDQSSCVRSSAEKKGSAPLAASRSLAASSAAPSLERSAEEREEIPLMEEKEENGKEAAQALLRLPSSAPKRFLKAVLEVTTAGLLLPLLQSLLLSPPLFSVLLPILLFDGSLLLVFLFLLAFLLRLFLCLLQWAVNLQQRQGQAVQAAASNPSEEPKDN